MVEKNQIEIITGKREFKELPDNLQIENKVMAAAVNMNIVKKDEWSNFIPKNDDKIELLQFVGGG